MRSARGYGAAAGIAALLACGPAPASATDAPACHAEAVLHPSSVVVGQQVIYTLRIARREDVERIEWARPLAFPGLRAEWLPGRAEQREGVRERLFYAREEERALFPARPGTLRIEGARLRCLRRGDGGEEVIVEVPAVVLEVESPPAAGRPETWDGLVGPIQVRTLVDPVELPLGGSVRVSVLVRGAANVWAAGAPLDTDALSERAEVFPLPPELALEPGRHLYARRFFRYDVVPHETGSLLVPEARVPYYDPVANAYRTARAAPARVEVTTPPAAAPRRAARHDRPVTPEAGAAPPAHGARWPWVVAASLALVAGSASALWRRSARRRPWREVDGALAEARERSEAPAGQAAALTRALRVAIAAVAPESASLAPAELEARTAEDPDLRAAARELAALERTRFSAAPTPPERAGVEAVIRRLRARAHAHR